MHNELLEQVIFLIKELRNSRDTEKNWHELKALVETNSEMVLSTFSSRWLVSICDTYSDYGNAVEKRNAFLISVFVNMIRIADTLLYLSGGKRSKRRIKQLKNEQIPLYDGLMTLHLDRQDTCLNLSKRMTRVLQETPFFLSMYKTIITRSLASKNLLSELASLSKMPERVFPLNALEMPDNYNVK